MSEMNIDQFLEAAPPCEANKSIVEKRKIKPIPKIINDRYKIKRVLGVGGMGVVYQVDDLLLKSIGLEQSEMAIKVLSSEATTFHDAELLLVNEYQQANELHHPNIVPIQHLALCNDSQQPFLIMPIIKGELLSLLLDSPFESIPTAARLKYAFVLINCVIHCHKRGVIHGDLKPSNILISDTNELYLFDFSISRNINPQKNNFAINFNQVHAWSSDYAAPEVQQGNAPTIKSDLYSLSILLYKLLLDTHPYQQKEETLDSRTKEQQKIHQLLRQAMSPISVERHLNFKALNILIKENLKQQTTNKKIPMLQKVSSVFSRNKNVST
ncbi:protein kinase [Aliivibrio sp. S4TY2]|uniref:protein kinase domain-containing protein n=1 Tax=unclassified Aliivibrio TaxID=2645654 RepID=UPI002379628D|nr:MULTISPECIES: protein kinase [unclassified Aliivibrio]MDD9157514.1 protein kinase [Aliivibrio sp. S4TY2]MDD9161292.1 protein kinase [Aliivibrio sp. S4TY1]MDD9165322.1 protein kinase [Aliivibrio sp. S4MY2]MDD9169423.1 protein kinase [Aliivibrio sp. S4MY4]MDD9186416.1 protein kinase [Aliivibrio sp. S4MY3]